MFTARYTIILRRSDNNQFVCQYYSESKPSRKEIIFINKSERVRVDQVITRSSLESFIVCQVTSLTSSKFDDLLTDIQSNDEFDLEDLL